MGETGLGRRRQKTWVISWDGKVLGEIISLVESISCITIENKLTISFLHISN